MNTTLSRWALLGLALAFVFTVSIPLLAEDRREQALEAFGDQLKAAVREGKLSEAEALEKWEAARDKLRAAEDREDEKDEQRQESAEEEHEIFFEGVGVALETAVEMGKLSKREAEQVWREVEQAIDEREEEEQEGEADQAEFDERYQAISRGLQAAVRLGKLSDEEAHEMWQKVTAERREDEEREERERLYEIMAEGLQAAVDLGKIDEEEARDMWRKLEAGEEEEEEAEAEDER